MKRFDNYYNHSSLRISTFGTGSDGEGVLLEVLLDDEKMVFLIDSVEDDSNILHFLNTKNISRIDYLIWTHPHDDHSKGIKKIINSGFDIGKVIMPDYINSFREHYSNYSMDVLKTIQTNNNNLKKIKKNNLELWSYDKVYDKRILINNNELYKFGEIVDELPFVIKIHAPIREVLFAREQQKSFNVNDLSIVIEIVYGDFIALLASDIENPILSFISSFEPIPNFLKVPHHGSDSSFDIIDKIYDGTMLEDEKIEIGVMTNMASSNLPKKTGINHYKSYIKNLYIPSDSLGKMILGFEVDYFNGKIKIFDNTNFVKV